MPLNYELYCGANKCNTTEEIEQIDNVYYKVITSQSSDNSDKQTFGFNNDETANFTLKINFPEYKEMVINNALENSIIGQEFADLVDNVNLSIIARQKIN